MSSLNLRLACLACLTIVILACSLSANSPFANSHHGGPSHIDTIEVSTNPSGAVHVAVDYTRGSDAAVTLSCTYPHQDGASRQYTYIDKRPSESGDDALRTDSFDFVLKRPGNYQITCQWKLDPERQFHDRTAASR